MSLRFLRPCKRRIQLRVFRLRHLSKEKFECPICGYHGPFEDVNPPTGLRKHAKCPQCRSLERHRLQYLVARSVLAGLPTSQMTMLHFAPEAFMRGFFSKQFGKYETADLHMRGVDHKVDLQRLPFADSTYDFVFASHVLEHVPNDRKAIQEIRRVLNRNGIAMLPVPLVSKSTVEYSEPNPHESYHVRAPGFDYFDRYTPYFSRVEQYTSDSLPERYQLFSYEDRSRWPTEECPLRPAMEGERHIDIVPVCYA
jgi:SAM-dependent methyltransferase